jgi:hypothetical protein
MKNNKMNGIEFYEFLRNVYQENGQELYGNFTFNSWLPKRDETYSFRFNGKSQLKSVPKAWLVDAKNAQNNGEVINANWFNTFYNRNNNNDCRARVAVWLLENH